MRNLKNGVDPALERTQKLKETEVFALPLIGCAAIPADEPDRLLALHHLNLLDTPPSEAFDRVTRMAVDMLEVPMALVSLVDEKRQWFKSRIGVAATETPREVSFCAHAIYNREPLSVADATRDVRFAGNPLVTGEPHIRAYLGMPIFSRAGHAIGTLCVLDTRPREFSTRDLRRIGDCANVLQESIQAQELAQYTSQLFRVAVEREALFRDTFEQAAVGMTHTSFAGSLLRVNQRACQMLGYSAEELHRISFIDITHPADIPKNMAAFNKMAAGELDSYQLEKRFLRKDGTYLWTEISIALKRRESGEPDYMIAVIEDIGARKQAETELIKVRDSLRAQVAEQTLALQEGNRELQLQVKRALESEHELRAASHRLRTITDSVPAMIGYWNCELRCEFANQGYQEWFGIDARTIVGMHFKELVGAVLYNKVEPHVVVALEGHAQRFEVSAKRADGQERICLVRYMPDRGADNAVAGFFVLITDVTESRTLQKALQQANGKLTSDSMTDYLTGISNRRVFSERSEEACQRSHQDNESYGLILLDLDNFKQINDRYGHGVGDEVLKVTGRLLKGQLRSHRDLAARLGGEEFAVLCFGHLDEELLRLIAERLRGQMGAQAIDAGATSFHFSSSFGLALSHPDDTNWKSIYSRADAALYEAKAAGKNRVMFGKHTLFSATSKFRALKSVGGS